MLFGWIDCIVVCSRWTMLVQKEITDQDLMIQSTGFAEKCRARREPLLRLGGDQRPAPAASRTARITLQRTG